MIVISVGQIENNMGKYQYQATPTPNQRPRKNLKLYSHKCEDNIQHSEADLQMTTSICHIVTLGRRCVE